MRCSVDTDFGTSKSKDDYRFAWALMADVGIDLASNVKLDLGYRYGVIDGAEIASAGITAIGDKEIKTHQLRAGIRFTTW